MQGVNPKGIQRSSKKTVSKAKRKKLSIRDDSELGDLKEEMDNLEEDLNEAFP